MIEWLYMLSAMLLFGIANFRRKGLQRGTTTTEAPFWESLGFLPPIAFVLLSTPLVLSQDFLLLALASALGAAAAVSLLWLALRDGYVSVVTTVTNLNTHLSAFLAFLVFAEPFSIRLAAGIALAAAVGFLFSRSKAVKPGKWVVFSLASLAAFALKNLVDKALSVSYDPLFAFAVVSLISIFVYAIPFARGRKTANAAKRIALAGNGFIIALAFASLFLSFSMVPLSIAAPVMGMNLLVTALLGAHFLKERLDARAWLAIALALVSIWLLAG